MLGYYQINAFIKTIISLVFIDNFVVRTITQIYYVINYICHHLQPLIVYQHLFHFIHSNSYDLFLNHLYFDLQQRSIYYSFIIHFFYFFTILQNHTQTEQDQVFTSNFVIQITTKIYYALICRYHLNHLHRLLNNYYNCWHFLHYLTRYQLLIFIRIGAFSHDLFLLNDVISDYYFSCCLTK